MSMIRENIYNYEKNGIQQNYFSKFSDISIDLKPAWNLYSNDPVGNFRVFRFSRICDCETFQEVLNSRIIISMIG